MTARELIAKLQALGEENLDKDILMFDGPSYCTPCKVKLITENDGWSKKFLGSILID